MEDSQEGEEIEVIRYYKTLLKPFPDPFMWKRCCLEHMLPSHMQKSMSPESGATDL